MKGTGSLTFTLPPWGHPWGLVSCVINEEDARYKTPRIHLPNGHKWDILFLNKAIGAQILLELRQNGFFHVHVPLMTKNWKIGTSVYMVLQSKREVPLLICYMKIINTIKEYLVKTVEWECVKYKITNSKIEIKSRYNLFFKTFTIPLEKIIINRCAIHGVYSCLVLTEKNIGITMVKSPNKKKVSGYSDNLINEIRTHYQGPLTIK